MIGEIRIGQRVRAFKKRWTQDGWEPIEELATAVTPCVPNGSDYARDIELKIDGVLDHEFAPPASIEPVEVGDAIRTAVLEKPMIAVEALEQSDRELVPDSLWASVKDDTARSIRALKGGLFMGLNPRRHREDAVPSGCERKFAYPLICEKWRHPLVHEAPSRRLTRNPMREWADRRVIPDNHERPVGCTG